MRTTEIRSILAATDLTVASDEVLRAAGALALATGAALHVVHAFDLELSPYPGMDVGPATFPGRIAEAGSRLALQLSRTLPAGLAEGTREVVIYVAHRAILDRAEDVGADLVVIGPHRGGPGSGRLLGTTADRVIRAARCPCLVVRGRLSLPLRRVLVPLDLSEPARGALETAFGWIDELGTRGADLDLAAAELDVVHVVPSLFASGDLPVHRATIGPRLHAELERSIPDHSPAISVREELLWGDGPAEEVLRYAERERCDLVVMATHGHGAIKRALIGSVASGVARAAPCPVLLVPPPLWADEDVPAEASAAAAAS